MTQLSDITTGINETSGSPVAAIRGQHFATLAEVFDRFPNLRDADAAHELARLVTHFARARKFRVITDATAFEAAYRAQIASEDPDVPWQQDVMRLVDFGMPDFAQIVNPVSDGTVARWTVTEAYTGLPYRVEAQLGDFEAVTFTALSLTPVARKSQAAETSQEASFPLTDEPAPADPADDATAPENLVLADLPPVPD